MAYSTYVAEKPMTTVAAYAIFAVGGWISTIAYLVHKTALGDNIDTGSTGLGFGSLLLGVG